MLYSKSSHAAGCSGFFFDEDLHPPGDAIPVSEDDFRVVMSLPAGSVYDFDADGVLSFAQPTDSFLLAQAQGVKLGELSVKCQAQIYAGFTSTALGAAYTYPAKDTDQQNLTASVVSSLISGAALGWTTPFWCADASGVWAFRAHTAAQIQQVGIDGKAAILAAMQKNQQLAEQVSAAADVASVQAIAWT